MGKSEFSSRDKLKLKMHLKQPEFKYTSCGTFRGRLHERRTELKAARDFSTIKLFIGLHEKSQYGWQKHATTHVP